MYGSFSATTPLISLNSVIDETRDALTVGGVTSAYRRGELAFFGSSAGGDEGRVWGHIGSAHSSADRTRATEGWVREGSRSLEHSDIGILAANYSLVSVLCCEKMFYLAAF